MNPLAAGLLQLKDIHQPPPISWWPLAWGWYGLIILVMGVVSFIWVYLRWQKHSFRRQVLKQFHFLVQQYAQNGDAATTISALSRLLKESLLCKTPRTDIAGLHETAWLEYLNKVSKTTAYTQGVGYCFRSIPYMEPLLVQQIAMQPIFNLVKQTIKRCL